MSLRYREAVTCRGSSCAGRAGSESLAPCAGLGGQGWGQGWPIAWLRAHGGHLVPYPSVWQGPWVWHPQPSLHRFTTHTRSLHHQHHIRPPLRCIPPVKHVASPPPHTMVTSCLHSSQLLCLLLLQLSSGPSALTSCAPGGLS